MAATAPCGEATGMFRLIGIIVAVALVAWLATRQLHDAGRETRAAAQAAGASDLRIDDNARPADVAAEVGRAVDAQVQASKQRLDAAEQAVAGDLPPGDGTAPTR
jgi:hypothetical protein